MLLQPMFSLHQTIFKSKNIQKWFLISFKKNFFEHSNLVNLSDFSSSLKAKKTLLIFSSKILFRNMQKRWKSFCGDISFKNVCGKKKNGFFSLSFFFSFLFFYSSSIFTPHLIVLHIILAKAVAVFLSFSLLKCHNWVILSYN